MGEDIYQQFGLEAMEVTDDVFLGKQGRQFQEAENRMHTIKAVLYATLKYVLGRKNRCGPGRQRPGQDP